LSESTNPTDDSSASSKQPDAAVQPPTDAPIEDSFAAAKRVADRASVEFGREIFTEFTKNNYKAKGFKTFNEYASFRGIEPWRALRLRKVFVAFSNLGLSYETLAVIGYDKATKLLGVIEHGNKEEWLKKARELSYDALVQEIKAKKPKKTRTVIKSTAGDQPQGYSPEDASMLAAKLAPERIRPSADGKTLANDDDVVYEKTLYLVGSQNTVFEAAIENVERRTGSDKVGYLLTCALLEYLAIEGTKDQKDDDRMRHYMWALQERYGGRLVWVRNEKVAEQLSDLIKQADPDGQANTG
jgi:hypothetical protein